MPIDDWKRYQAPWRTVVYGSIWVLALVTYAYQYISTGEPNPWSIPVLLVGFLLFLVAKLSIIKQTGFLTTTFGASAAALMSRNMKVCYYGGYIIMIAGFLFAFRHP